MALADDIKALTEELQKANGAIVALGERVAKLEDAPKETGSTDAPDIAALTDALNALNVAVMGVPVGAVQSLKD